MSGVTNGSMGRRAPRRVTLLAWAGVLVLLVLIVASCAKPPEAELSAAEVDIDRAKQSEAQTYAQAELRAAEDSLAAARSEVDRQNAKFALFRKYGEAQRKAIAAQEAGRKAAEAAVANKEKVRQEAERTLAQAQQALADVRNTLESPVGKRLTRAKGQRQAIEQIKAELDAIEASLENVRQAQVEERFHDASRMAKEALNKVQERNKEVSDAIEKLTGGS